MLPRPALSLSLIHIWPARDADASRVPAGSFDRLLEVQPRARTCALGESDADFAHLVPFHGRHGPGQALPLHLVTDYRLATDLVGDEAAQRLIAFQLVELQAIERGDCTQFGVAFQYEIAEETQVLTCLLYTSRCV